MSKQIIPPTWDGVPPEYRWRAMDEDGTWWFYQQEPEYNPEYSSFNYQDGDLSALSLDELYEKDAWRTTAQQRVKEEEI